MDNIQDNDSFEALLKNDSNNIKIVFRKLNQSIKSTYNNSVSSLEECNRNDLNNLKILNETILLNQINLCEAPNDNYYESFNNDLNINSNDNLNIFEKVNKNECKIAIDDLLKNFNESENVASNIHIYSSLCNPSVKGNEIQIYEKTKLKSLTKSQICNDFTNCTNNLENIYSDSSFMTTKITSLNNIFKKESSNSNSCIIKNNPDCFKEINLKIPKYNNEYFNDSKLDLQVCDENNKILKFNSLNKVIHCNSNVVCNGLEFNKMQSKTLIETDNDINSYVNSTNDDKLLYVDNKISNLNEVNVNLADQNKDSSFKILELFLTRYKDYKLVQDSEDECMQTNDHNVKVNYIEELNILPKKILECDKLFPCVPNLVIGSEEEAFSSITSAYVINRPLCRIVGLCRSLKLKLELFTTAVLVKTRPNFRMEIRVQPRPTSMALTPQSLVLNKPWYLASRPSYMTIEQYAKYQAMSFIRAKNKIKGGKSKFMFRRNTVNFGTNVDLSNSDIWSDQLQELHKLPDFLKVLKPTVNLLNHIGHNVLGVNTVQLYMKVPGCRTPGHQENNNFSAVNMNVGPGVCEWFFISENYWSKVSQLCAQHGIDYLSGSWWPDELELATHNIPIYHLLQHPGDIIWIGPGTIHWVQAIGWCNNVAWNVGPMSSWQYTSAIERYEYNRCTPKYKSIVPMIQLSWNLARAANVSESKPIFLDQNILHLVLRVLFVCLSKMRLILLRVKSLGKEVMLRERLPNDLAHYCHICMDEVFNILLASKNNVYCFNCAINKSKCLKDFHILKEYSLSSLVSIYKNFKNKYI